MSDMLDLVARLRAYEAGRAICLASHRRLALHPEVVVLSPLVMAGEDSALHLVLIGQIHRRPYLLGVPDPRNREDLYSLFERLADELEAYFQHCQKNHSYPQLWVSSGAAADLVDQLADRLRFSQQYPKAQRLGLLLTYPAGRVHIAGQQTLIIAPHALQLHWITGQQEEEDEHLAAFLTWLDPPPGFSIHDAVTQAETIPSGIKTPPAFDRQILAPLVRAFLTARKQQAPPTELGRRARAIRDALFPLAHTIFMNTQRAYDWLQQSGLPPLPSLPRFEEREIEEFLYFMRQLTQGTTFPTRDSERAAALGLSAREEAEALTTAVFSCEDAVERARGRLSGAILSGVVQDVHQGRGRTVQHRFQLLCPQAVIRVRERDEFYWADDLRVKVSIEAIERSSAGIMLTCLMVEGMRSVGVLRLGTRMELVPSRPDWYKLARERQHLSRRLPRPARTSELSNVNPSMLGVVSTHPFNEEGEWQ